ncbi:MAG: NAD(P)-dependent oxidoreductase [Betaproteobacteria bacterium]
MGMLGCGLVGTAIAHRLAAAGVRIAGHDIDAGRRPTFERTGGRWCDAAADALGASDVLLLALPDTRAAEAVLDSLTTPEALRTRTVGTVIDFGTDDPERVRRLAEKLAAHGIALIDAPLSGSSAQIADDESVMMIGGDAAAIARVDTLLVMVASRRFVIGASGSGARAKLATNLVLGLNRAALAEGFALAETLGIDLGVFLTLVRAGPAWSAAADAKGGKMLRADYSAQSRIRQHRKDVALMIDIGRRLGQSLPLSEAHAALLDAAIAAGDGERDNAAILEQFRRLRFPRMPSPTQEKP